MACVRSSPPATLASVSLSPLPAVDGGGGGGGCSAVLIHRLCVSHSHAVRSLRLLVQNTGFPPNFETLPASGRFNCSGPANRGFMFCSITQLQGSTPPNCKNTHFLARPCRKTAVTGNNNVKLFSPPVVKEPSAVTSSDERRERRTENGPSCSLRTNKPKKNTHSKFFLTHLFL